MRSTTVLVLLSAMTGLAWGIVAWLFGATAFGAAIGTGVVASPVIGVAVGLATQRWFESATPHPRKGIALLSLYLGVTLFGVTVGLWDWWPGGVGQALLSSLGEGIGTALWGVTAGGFVIGFWPLAYLTHYLLAKARQVPLARAE